MSVEYSMQRNNGLPRGFNKKTIIDMPTTVLTLAQEKMTNVTVQPGNKGRKQLIVETGNTAEFPVRVGDKVAQIKVDDKAGGNRPHSDVTITRPDTSVAFRGLGKEKNGSVDRKKTITIEGVAIDLLWEE